MNSSGTVPSPPHQLVVHVDAAALQLLVIGARIVRGQGDAGLAAGLVVALRPRQCDGGPASGRRHLDPAVTLPERNVGGEREAELVGVERDRSVLVGDRDDHPADVLHLCHVVSFR
jgi:hypothetical protein